MTPIERVSARSKALTILGLVGTPTRSEVRKMFRKLAFERHPDHGKGTPEEFARISDAYHLLFGLAEDDSIPAPANAPRMSRPSVQATETEFGEAVLVACEAVLGQADATCVRHVATQLRRRGRMLTYFVPSNAGKGLNRVAVPTGDLVDTRRIHPQVVDVWSGDLSGNVFQVPAQLCERLFPGARSVQICFGNTTSH